MTLHPGTAPALTGSAVSCYEGFNMHATLGDVGQIIGILSGLASLAWVAYQYWSSRKKP